MTDRRAAALLGTGSLLLSVPYVVLGPNLILDDWFTLYFRLHDGLLWTGGHAQLRARPGSWLVYLVEYGLIGAHPLAIYVLQALLVAATVVALFLAGRRLLGQGTAVVVAGTWALLANHSTLDRWGAAMPALVCLLLAAVGVALLQRPGSEVAAVCAFVVSALSYEASVPVAVIAIVAVPRLLGRRSSLARTAALEAPILATAGWMFAHSQHRTKEFSGWFDFGSLFHAHVGDELVHIVPVALGLTVVGAVGATLALARPLFPSLRPLSARATSIVAAGMGIIVLGIIPFARYPISAVGLGDRSNVIASVGTALVWVGIGTLVWDRRRAVGTIAAAVFGVILAVGHLERDVDYARAGRDTARVVAAVRAVQDRDPTLDVVVGPSMPTHHRIVGLIGTMDQVVQADSGDEDRRARVASDTADWDRAPAARRVDVRRVLGR